MKKTSLKNVRSLASKQGKKFLLKARVTEEDSRLNQSSNSNDCIVEPFVQILSDSSESDRDPLETKLPGGRDINECTSFAKRTFNKYGTRSKRKDKENYVFIVVLNDYKEAFQGHGERSLDVIDISSTISNKDSLLEQVTVENVNFTPAHIKNVIEKIIGDLSNKRNGADQHPVTEVEAKDQYFLVLNCSIPFNVADISASTRPESKFSNKRNISKSNKNKMTQKQQSPHCDSVSSKGVHKFKGGLTKRYLSDSCNKEVVNNDNIDNENNINVNDYDDVDADYSPVGHESNDEEAESHVQPKPKSRRLRSKKKLTTAKQSNLGSDGDDSAGTRKARQKRKQHHCERCVKTFNTLKLLKTHMKRACCRNRNSMDDKKGRKAKQGERCNVQFECDMCKSSFRTKRELRSHIRKECNNRQPRPVAKGGTAICDVCGKMCRNRSYLREHMAGHENLRAFECAECGKGFNKGGFLRKHIKTVHRKSRYLYFCSHCGLKSESKEHIEMHEQVHTLPEGVEVPRPYQCLCGKSFISKHALRCHRHKSVNHDGGGKPLRTKISCPICGKMLASTINLNLHLETMHDLVNPNKREKVFGCDQCDKKFARFGSFINHKLQAHREEVSMGEAVGDHGTQAPVRCPFCQKECRNRAALAAHKYFRHGPTGRVAAPATCQTCQKTFKNRGSLLSHNYRIHRPLELAQVTCKFCQKTFNDKNTLWAHHKYVHSTDNPHCCSECGSKFKRKGDYTRHLRDKHNALPAPHRASQHQADITPQDDGYNVGVVMDHDHPIENNLGNFTFEVLHCEHL